VFHTDGTRLGVLGSLRQQNRHWLRQQLIVRKQLQQRVEQLLPTAALLGGAQLRGPLIIVCKPSTRSMLLAVRVAVATLAHRSASDAAMPGTCYVSSPTGVCAVSAVLQRND
jgi:hypothetical protein